MSLPSVQLAFLLRTIFTLIFECYFSDDSKRCQHTSNPLGNGAVVETADRNILVLQRSHNVGEFPGYFVFPGGHPEVSHVKFEKNTNYNHFAFSLMVQKSSNKLHFPTLTAII